MVEEVVREDPLFGGGHWVLGAVAALEDRVADACREWCLMFEGDLRTAQPVVDSAYGHIYSKPPRAYFAVAARYLRRHSAEFLAASRNRGVAAIILGDQFDTQRGWLQGLELCMKNGWYDEALPIAQSFGASYLQEGWFADEADCDDAGIASLKKIYLAAGVGCRVGA